MHELLKIGPRISVMPVIHGTAECALQVRRVMLDQNFDCVAVPLPPSFQPDVESGIERLPTPTIVTQQAAPRYTTSWSPREDDDDDEEEDNSISFVPIDPCQPVIMGLRIALGERLPREFIDLETASFQPLTASLPDAYALQKLPVERFAAAVLPFLARPPEGHQVVDRIRHMARRLRELERRHRNVLLICSILHWPWLREAFRERLEPAAEDDFVEDTALCQPDPKTLLFMLGELPFITALYERRAASWTKTRIFPSTASKNCSWPQGRLIATTSRIVLDRLRPRLSPAA